MEANARRRREPDAGNPEWGCRSRATQQSTHRVGNVKLKNLGISSMSIDAIKNNVGAAAAALVEPGMVVGLGTGSTAAYFVKHLIKDAAAD